MQRRLTKGGTRGPNAAEKRFMQWISDKPCCICGAEWGIEVDHCYGSTRKKDKVLIGHWFLLPYCHEHHAVKTRSRKDHDSRYGVKQITLWLKHIESYTRDVIPEEVILAAIREGNV